MSAPELPSPKGPRRPLAPRPLGALGTPRSSARLPPHPSASARPMRLVAEAGAGAGRATQVLPAARGGEGVAAGPRLAR